MAPVAMALAGLLAFGATGQAQQAPPDEDWRTISTERARVTFPARLEALGRRAAHRTEVALSALDSAFLAAPEGTIDILLTDHTDISNGFARVTPSNRITIYARPPVDEPGLGYFDDWLELVLTHELAHVVHLDPTDNPLGQILRAVFGRVPTRWPFFPGHGTPRWVKEGIATWYESALTDAGRLRGTFHEMQIRTAVLGDRFEGVGQASASSPVWPAGNRPYLYGSLFFEHMLERHGEDRMAAFAEAVAGQWVPYRLDAAAQDAFDVSFSDAWREWADSLEARYADLEERLADLGSVTEPHWVTSGARWAVEPQVGPAGTLAYVRSDGRSDTRIVLEPVQGAGRAASVRVNGVASFDWMPDGRLLVGQLEREDPYRVYGDLYLVEPDGRTRRVTRAARLAQPAAGPDGTWAVAVQEGGGTSELVRVSLVDGSVASLSEPDGAVHWGDPAVSPDGAFVAATRRVRGGAHDVVVLDAETGTVRAELTSDRALDLAPSWSPDGRWVVWASDRTGILNVLAASFDPDTGTSGPPRLLSNVRTGVNFPSIDPTGRHLHYSAYHAEGWDVARMPFEPRAAPEAPPPHARFERERPFEGGAATGEVEAYSPIPTLLPRYWKPLLRAPVRTPAQSTSEGPIRERELLGFGVGAQTGSRDIAGRHAYDAFGRVFTSGGKVEGGLAYAYWGLGNPVLSLSASQHWDDDGVRLGRSDPEAAPDTLFVLERERSVSASGRFRVPSWRDRLELTVTAGLVEEARTLLNNDLRAATSYRLARPSVDLVDVRGTVSYSTARSHAFQVGSSKGVDLFLSGRSRQELNAPDSVRGVVGRDRSVDDVVGRARGYVPLGGRGHASHLLAVQLTGGVAGGPNAPGGHFEVGGASGRPETLSGLRLFGGSPLFFGARGYPRQSRLGRYAWTASGEYRFPLRLVHRGLGTWPLYLGRVVGALFADAGDAWDPDTTEAFLSAARRPLASVGAEVAAEVVALYDFPLLTRVGLAQPLVGGGGPSVYVRLGLSF
ncbi:MAG: hypothetical protein U5R14_11210 [Gemmatimonadota bacterium]|nr:hypothetical protein [Gemmatimonadota bacterium]